MSSYWAPIAGETMLAVNAFTVNPNTCHPAISTSPSPWCSIGNSGAAGYVQMINVTSSPQ